MTQTLFSAGAGAGAGAGAPASGAGGMAVSAAAGAVDAGELVRWCEGMLDAAQRAISGTMQSWTPADRRAVLAVFEQVANSIEVHRAAVLVAERDSGSWKSTGVRSVEDWHATQTRTGKSTGRSRMAVAETLDAAPEIGHAVREGSVTMEHARVLARTRQQAPHLCRDGFTSGTGRALLELAKQEDAGQFAKSAQRWVATLDPVGFDKTQQSRRQARYLHVSETASATYLKGQLDPVSGRTLRIALEAALGRPGKDDDRSPGQRHADALVALAQHSLDRAESKNGALVRPHVTVLVNEDTFRAVRLRAFARPTAQAGGDLAHGAHRAHGAHGVADSGAGGVGSADRTGSPGADHCVGPTGTDADHCIGPDSDDGSGPSEPFSADAMLPGHAPATFEDGTAVSLSEFDQLLCDCEITRVVMNQQSVPVNIGRTERLYSREQRRAVIARDRHCQFPGCFQPARWCEVHHIRWWQRDHGETSVDNGILLCTFHHHEVHARDLMIVAADVSPRVPTRTEIHGGRGSPRLTASHIEVESTGPPRPDHVDHRFLFYEGGRELGVALPSQVQVSGAA